MTITAAKQYAGIALTQAKQAFGRGPVFIMVIILPAAVSFWLMLVEVANIYHGARALFHGGVLQHGVRIVVCAVTLVVLGIELAGFFMHKLRTGRYRWIVGFSGIVWAAAVLLVWNFVPGAGIRIFGALSGADMAAITYGALFGVMNWVGMDFRKVEFSSGKGGKS